MAGTDKSDACIANAGFMFTLTDDTVTFINLSTGANKYLWEFGDGGTSTSTAPVHVYASPGRYHVILHAYDSTIGGCEDTVNNYSILISGCALSANFKYSIEDSMVSFYQNSYNFLGTGDRHEWFYGDGSSDGGTNPVHKYMGSGPYDLVYVFSDTDFVNCTDTVRRTFYLDDCDVVADFTYEFIGPKSIKITNTSVNADVFSLPFDTAGEYIINFTVPGTQRIFLQASNSWCYSQDSAIKYVDVYIQGCYANAYFSFGRDTNSTFAGVLYDYSTYRPGATYKWHFGDGDSSSSKTPNHVYPGPGKYNICLTITDSVCVSTYCDSIEYDSSGVMQATVPFSLEVVDAVLSVKDVQAAQDQVSVYPNPASGILNISQDLEQIRQVQVYDLQGKLIISELFNDLKVSLDISGLTKGVYMLVISDEAGKTTVVRVIKS